MEELSRAEKLRVNGVAKYGSEQAWREEMRRRGAMARRDTPRGFTVIKERNPELLQKISRKGVKKRWG